jgi:WD40 repeat protein
MLYLIENRKVIHKERFGNGDSIACMQVTKHGIAVAGSGGFITIYNFSQFKENEAFKIVQKVPLPDNSIQVVGLSSTIGEDNVLAEFSTNQVFKLKLTGTGEVINNSPDELVKFDPFLESYHSNAITGMDLCVRKPLLATCSSDKSIRIWNYLTGTCELMKTFGDEPQSISLHPSGLYLLAGFSDKLRLLNILMDDLRPVREFSIRACKKCIFANGGHIFAAVHGNIVQIFSTWSFENIENLKGHNGKVKSLYFTPDDSSLVSAGSDGAVYTWNMKQMKREHEHILKSCSYFDAVCSPNGKVMFAVGTDKMVKEITESSVTKEFDGNQVMTQIALSNSGRMLFVGTQMGTIRALRFPFGDQHDFQEHQAHNGPVTKLKVSYDDQYLFSAGEDGCLYMYKLTEKEGKKERQNIFADEVLFYF